MPTMSPSDRTSRQSLIAPTSVLGSLQRHSLNDPCPHSESYRFSLEVASVFAPMFVSSRSLVLPDHNRNTTSADHLCGSRRLSSRCSFRPLMRSPESLSAAAPGLVC